MMTCKACGKELNEDAYVVGKKMPYFYFCNENEYRDYLNELSPKDHAFFLLCEIFGYYIQNTAFFKEVHEWEKIASEEKILAYIKERYNYLDATYTKLQVRHASEYATIKYMSAILKNSLVDFEPNKHNTIETVPEGLDISLYDTEGIVKHKRRSLEEMEDEA